MIRYISLITFCIVVLCTSCRSDFETVASNGTLSFSKDTIYLDTTFTNIGSSTYTLKVYNKSSNDISIPNIRLAKGETSQYRMLVNGKATKSINDVTLLAKDSIFIFVETTIDYAGLQATENTFLYTDKIEFDYGDRYQKVELVTLVQDAVFLYPQKNNDGSIPTIVLNTNEDGSENRENGFTLSDENLTWTSQKPYVIYGYAVVPPGKKLQINPGARIHFHERSGILVTEGATIQAQGKLSETKALENEIIFQGDRLQTIYKDVAGQWGTIWIKPTSTNNLFEHVTLKNGTIGIRTESIENNALLLKKTQIYNHSNYGVFAINAFIKAENVVFNNFGVSGFRNDLGGNYDFKHCTLANYWGSGVRRGKSIYLSNQLNATLTSTKPLTARFDNCIIYGNSQIEIEFNQNAGDLFDFKFNTCLIRYNTTFTDEKDNPLLDFTNTNLYSNIIINKDPKFKTIINNDFNLTADSPVIGIGNQIVANSVPTDITGKDRTQSADLGAYQFQEKE